MHLEIHYLPCLEYMSLLVHSSHVDFEVMENFPKQTYRNRTYLLGANGVECLTVPTLHLSEKKILMKDIQIDYQQDWQRRHLGAIQAGYGKAPFYEYFEPDIRDIFAKKNKFLVDLNIDLIRLIMKILNADLSYSFTDQFHSKSSLSYWNQIKAKQDWHLRSNVKVIPYRQCFGDSFVPNLSILDLLMNHGRESKNILFNFVNIEQIDN
jgi:hypothetical protein